MSREFKSVSLKPTCNRYKCNDKSDQASLLSENSSKRAKQNGAKRYVTIIEPPPLFKISPPPNPLLFLSNDNGFQQQQQSSDVNSDQSSNYKRFLIHMLNVSQEKSESGRDFESDSSTDARIYDACNSFRLNFSPSLNEDQQELKYSIDLSKSKSLNEPRKAKEKHYTVEISPKKSQSLNRLTSTKFTYNQSLNSTSQTTRPSILSNQSGLKDSSNLFNLFIFSTISFIVFVALLVFVYVVLTR